MGVTLSHHPGGIYDKIRSEIIHKKSVKYQKKKVSITERQWNGN